SNPPSRAGTGHHDPQAPAPSPACGGRLGWGPRRRRACCFRRLAAPTPPSPAGGGGGQGPGGPGGAPPPLPRGRGRGTTIRKLRPLPPLAGEGWDGGRAAGALAAFVVWLPPPRPSPVSGGGRQGHGGPCAPAPASLASG